MNYQPTEDRIKQIEEHQEELKKRIENLERQTEPIKITRLEIDQGDIREQLVSLKKAFDAIQADIAILKEEITGARADILAIRASQSDFGEYLKEDRQTQKYHTDQLERHAESVGQLIEFGESHEAMLQTVATKDDIATMATKDDLIQLEARMGSIETTQGEQNKRLDRIEATMATKQDLQALGQQIQDTLIKFLRPPK